MLGGHPRALSTLFFTEMWERFTFYGMRALLVLFLVDAVESGGYGFDDKTATAIYGLYTAAVFMAALPGGWIADRLVGAQRAVMIGGTLMTLGTLMLAIPGPQQLFFGGLCGEEADSLWDEAGFVEAGDAAEGGDDRGVEPACADGGVAKVDGGVP